MHGGLAAAMDGNESTEVAEPDPLTWQERRMLSGSQGPDHLSVAYSPSIRTTDFSEGLPGEWSVKQLQCGCSCQCSLEQSEIRGIQTAMGNRFLESIFGS